MKKELIISTYDSQGNPYYSGGGASAIHEVAKRFVDEYRVTILTGNYQGAKDKMIDAVHYKHIGPSSFGPSTSQIFFHLLLPFYILTSSFDYWIENFTPPISTSFLPLFTRKPVIGLVHMLSGEDMKRKYKLPFDLVEKIGLKLYKYFIVLSESTKLKIQNLNIKAKVLVTKNGIFRPRNLRDYTKRSRSYILFLGRIEVDQKGLDLLINSYQEVYKKTKTPLKIAGTGSQPELDKLRKLIKHNNLDSVVEMVGQVSGQNKHKILSGASIVVIPSRFETFSITALESISYNIPLVCCDINGMKWIPDGDSDKFTFDSSECLAKTLISLQKNEAKRFKMSTNQKNTVKDFSWSSVFSEYSNFLKEI